MLLSLGKSYPFRRSSSHSLTVRFYEPVSCPFIAEVLHTDFVDYYSYRRYHKALGDVTPADVLYGRREQILQRRKEVRIQTVNHRRDYNQALKELVHAA